MFNLTEMTAKNWLACSDALSEMATGGSAQQTMEDVACDIVTYLYENLRTGDGGGSGASGEDSVDGEAGRACALVRLYKTHSYRNLPLALMDFVDAAMGDLEPLPAMKCLTLLATRGKEPEWNHRSQSVGHQAIPLVSEEMVARIPMVARLVDEFGLDAKAVLRPDADLILDLAQKKYQVFHVPDAPGSPYIPAQDSFVQPYGIRSVVGFGGMLPSGDLFAVILFSRVPINRETAEEFASLALPVKISLLPFVFRGVFRTGGE